MDFDREKFKALVHYVCWRCKDDTTKLGSTKLNKILWLCDFNRYYLSGTPLTGAAYSKQQFGPVPRAIMPVLRELAEEGTVHTREVSFHGRTKTDFIVNRAPDAEFDDAELKDIDRIIKYVCEQHTAKSISDLSHDRVWHAADSGEDIPYYTVFAVAGEISESDREWARQEIEAIGTL